MKKPLHFYLLVISSFVLTAVSNAQAESIVTIKLEAAGTLASKLGAQSTTVTDLTISGPMNQVDFATLLTMGKNNLEILNLKEALPEGDSIPSRSLGLAKKIESLILPKTLTRIGTFAFVSMPIKTIELPATLTSIGEYAFRNTNITEFTIAPGNTAFVSVDGVLYSADKKTIVCYPSLKPGTVYTLLDGTTRVANAAFDYCKLLIQVKLPASVEEIGEEAFHYAETLTTINLENVKEFGFKSFDGTHLEGKLNLPAAVNIGGYAFSSTSVTEVVTGDHLKTIGNSAFWLCKLITTATFGKNITFIGGSSFHMAELLSTIYCYAAVPPTMEGYNAFYYKFESDGTLFVPHGSLEAYRTAPLWKQIKNIKEMAPVGVNDAKVQTSQVYAIAGSVVVKTDVNAIVRIYNAGGATLVERQLPAGSHEITMPKGTYYVSLNHQKATPVMVR